MFSRVRNYLESLIADQKIRIDLMSLQLITLRRQLEADRDQRNHARAPASPCNEIKAPNRFVAPLIFGTVRVSVIAEGDGNGGVKVLHYYGQKFVPKTAPEATPKFFRCRASNRWLERFSRGEWNPTERQVDAMLKEVRARGFRVWAGNPRNPGVGSWIAAYLLGLRQSQGD